MEKRLIIKIVMSFGIFISANIAFCASNGNECLSKWRELVSEGSNHVFRAAGTDAKRSPQEWFCEVMKYEIPTNDVERYGAWLTEKAEIIKFASRILEADHRPFVTWNALAGFMSDIKNRVDPCSSGQFVQKHIEEWGKNNRLSTLDEWQRWRKAYQRDRRYRGIWSRASMEMEHTIEQMAKSMPPERRKMFMEIIIAKTKIVPEWYRITVIPSRGRPTTTSP